MHPWPGSGRSSHGRSGHSLPTKSRRRRPAPFAKYQRRRVADAAAIMIALLRLLRQINKEAATASRNEIRWATTTYVAQGHATTFRIPSTLRGTKDEAMMKEAAFERSATNTPSIATETPRIRTCGNSFLGSWFVTIVKSPRHSEWPWPDSSE